MDAYDSHMPGFACGAAGRSVDGNAAERGRYPLTERSEGAVEHGALVTASTKEMP
jgi:hypothetical protein